MPLKGTLDTMALPDLLQWLGAARKTGVVILSQGKVSKRLFLDNGLVSGSASEDPADFLGQLLLSFGRITEKQLRDALESKQSLGNQEFLGTTFVRQGLITEAELTRMLTLQTEETIYSLFAWERAQFEFQDGPPEAVPFPVALTVEDILLKGARRFDEMMRIREVVPSGAAVPRRTSRPLPAPVVQSVNLMRIAEAIDGVRSITAIALHTHTTEFIVSKFLFEGIRAGFVEIAAVVKPERRSAPSEMTQAARRLFEAGDYEGVLTLLDNGSVDPEDPLAEMIRQSEERFVEEALRYSMRPDRIPSLLRPTTDLLGERLSPEEFFLITRIDGTWDIRSILSVSPLREAEALKVLSRLQKRGFITIKDPVPVPVR